ncbi:D-amino-acid transaminase [Varunaivibrio sulfuroxidans]|uniref:Probable branched-chain-amino-acid aminotransferase n=1 Tax=Varunaivibrio sulfuroxidans TaxID=1773489 RepID=A0A4R3J5Q0_9PROT|nr:D-amino-acid transaminase [Varunaivibrio sulfuroxidans]TCS61219.1 D-alanine transaminase [Varunaivibrio sulfuroxidans]WES31160.1 D-amino-acid transaminase [Varunaivibrio sulfuroxidans]
MALFAYVNGRYELQRGAGVHIEDRGYQFADGVYEVIAVQNGRLIDEVGHLDRLERSLSALEIAAPMDRAPLGLIMRRLLEKNRIDNGMIYLQITRGVAPRNHAFPEGMKPSIVMTARRLKPFSRSHFRQGVCVITRPDTRWKRCDIKSISLLPNILSKQEAVRSGAFEAWLVDDAGNITEGASSNAWIVTGDARVVTRDAGGAILNGITRQRIIALARENGLSLEERPFSLEEATEAAEAFTTSSTALLRPVVKIDDRVIADGEPGPFSLKLLDLYAAHMERGGEAP